MPLLFPLRLRLIWVGLFVVLLGLPLAAEAVVAQAFQSTTSLPSGALVALDPNNPSAVTLASNQNVSSLTGVVTTYAGKSPTAADQILVASSGVSYVLVSDINGPIQKGDYITASPFAGVGARALSSGTMVGTAQVDFTGREQGDSLQVVKVGSTNKVVHIGQIPVQLVVGRESLASGGLDSYIPPTVQSIADSIAGHPVAALRLIMAALLIFMGLLGSSVILYSAVKNSMVSIGRNPLARRYVYRNLIQVILVVLLLLAACLGGVYLIITLA